MSRGKELKKRVVAVADGTTATRPQEEYILDATCTSSLPDLTVAAALPTPATSPLKRRRKAPPGSVLTTLAGAALLVALVAACLLVPSALPHLFVAFVLIALPWRAVSFSRRKYIFFMVDYCYFVNVLVAAFLVSEPGGRRPREGMTWWQGFQAGIYATAEGPLASALVAWRCAWVLGSHDHTISVLIHLLPGLAMTVHRHHWAAPVPLCGGVPGEAFPPPGSPALHAPRRLFLEAHRAAAELSAALRGRADGAWWQRAFPAFIAFPSPPLSQPLCTPGAWAAWLVAAPLAFYAVWQLLYLLIVQVACRGYIRSRGLDTSYNALARRAAKAGGGLVSNFVRRGSITRRVCAYGLVQLAFTVATLTVGVLTYHYAPAAVAWQVVKFMLPLSWGWIDSRAGDAAQRWE